MRRNICYASFILRGERLNAQTITSIIGIEPFMAFTKGDIRKDGHIWPHGYWELCSQKRIKSHDLIQHIEFLLGSIEPVQISVRKAIKKYDLEALISCFIISTTHEELELPSAVIVRLAKLRIKLFLELYIDEDKGTTKK